MALSQPLFSWNRQKYTENGLPVGLFIQNLFLHCINKREFKDALSLSYSWSIQDMPNFCACGLKNDMDHILTCKRGEYVYMRHNAIRDTEAKIMREVCSDIKIEPNMLPVGMDNMI